MTGIFQPHLYSRTQDFAAEFANSLDLLDKTILLPLYPAREKPIPGVSSEIIFDKMMIDAKVMAEKEEAMELIKNDSNEIILTMGAGDIDRLVPGITKLLENN